MHEHGGQRAAELNYSLIRMKEMEECMKVDEKERARMETNLISI